jgi:hypothetical protein
MILSVEKNGWKTALVGKVVMVYFLTVTHSYGHSQIDAVCKYVLSQEMHYKEKTFREEYHNFLEKFSIPYEEKYLFDFIE